MTKFLKQHLIDLRDMVCRLKRAMQRENDPWLLTELQAYRAWNQELLERNAWTDDLTKKKDMQIEVLLKKDVENYGTINQFRLSKRN